MFLVIFFALHSYVGEWEGLTADKHFEMSLKRQWNMIKRVQDTLSKYKKRIKMTTNELVQEKLIRLRLIS